MPNKKGFLARAPFPVVYRQQVAAASLLTGSVIFTNQAGGVQVGGGEYYSVLSVEAFWDVVSGSGTIDLRNVPASTAITGGTSILTATISSASGVRTVTKGSLSTADARRIAPGSVLSLILGGTLTGLVGCCVTVWLQPIRGVRNR